MCLCVSVCVCVSVCLFGNGDYSRLQVVALCNLMVSCHSDVLM